MASSTVCFTEGMSGNCTCTYHPPPLPPRPNFCMQPTTTVRTGLIVGCTCGAIIFIIILVLIIWWFWKKGKFCFRHRDHDGKSGSRECLPDGEEKQVELVNVKKGTVVLNPLSNPPRLPPLASPEQDGPPSKPPTQNTDPGLTPVEGPKEEEAGASPSQTTEGRPDSATSKKKKRRASRSNKVSPTPTPEPKQQAGTE